MITNTKPKRKAEFTHKETGQQLFLDRIKSNTLYFMCDSPNLSIQDNYFDVKVDLLIPARKVGSGLVSKPKPMTPEKKTEKQELNEFFAKVALKMPFECQCCGKPLYAHNQFAKRCVSAHLLPKAIFKSIATDENNIMFLGADIIGVCNCHDVYDRDVQSRKGMLIFGLVIERFELLLKPKLNQAELVQAYTYLGISWQ